MKIAPRDMEGFLRAPPSGIRAVLLYGPDGGLVRERARALTALVAGDPGDPFRVAELTNGEIKSDPARLADEAAAMAFGGGRRAVRLRDADDASAPAIQALLTGTASDSLVVVEAGDLPARSALRKSFETAAAAAALACYRDDERALGALVGQTLREAGLSASPDALAYLAANLGGDRMTTRHELDKLVLYMGAGSNEGEAARRRVELEDAQACVGDSAALSLDDLAYALGDGDYLAMERALSRSLREGANPVAILRAAARHLMRLHLVAGLAAQGTALDTAMKKLRPPLFWKLAPRFRAQAQALSPDILNVALGELLEAERACKRGGAPGELLCAQALSAITRACGSKRRGRRAGS
jgi:DNA polymerase III subunit delta